MDSNLRKLQLSELETFKKVLSILESNNIKYYALAGTVLGAVRHKGFIPWDDDIDIGIPRHDYERLYEVLKNRNDIKIIYNWGKKGMNVHHAIKIVNPNIRVTMMCSDREDDSYIGIDLFPLDSLSGNKIMSMIQQLRIYFYRTLQIISEERMIKRDRSLIEKITINIVRFIKFDKLLDSEKCIKKLYKILLDYSHKYQFDKNSYYINAYGWYKFKEAHPIKIYGEGIIKEFENIKINLPIDYVFYLKSLYGNDYMELPPENKRDHHMIQSIEYGVHGAHLF